MESKYTKQTIAQEELLGLPLEINFLRNSSGYHAPGDEGINRQIVSAGVLFAENARKGYECR